jgi:hypothetical protein
VTEAVLVALREKAGDVLKPDTALIILTAAYGAVGERLQLASINSANRPFIGAALEAVFGTVFDPAVNAEAKWVLARDAGVSRLTTIVLDALARHGATEQRIVETIALLRAGIQALGAGKPWTLDEFAATLDTAMAA